MKTTTIQGAIIMLAIKELEQRLNHDLEVASTVLESNEDTVLVRYNKDGHLEYAVLRYNVNGFFGGHYFPTIIQSQTEARNNAWDVYKKHIKEK